MNSKVHKQLQYALYQISKWKKPTKYNPTHPKSPEQNKKQATGKIFHFLFCFHFDHTLVTL